MAGRKKIMPKKRASVSTIEGLAGMIADMHEEMIGRFERVDIRFEQVDDRFEQIDTRFERVDARFEQVNDRFGRLEAEVRGGFAQVTRQLDRIETRIAALEFAVFGASHDVGKKTSYEDRLARLEKAVFTSHKK